MVDDWGSEVEVASVTVPGSIAHQFGERTLAVQRIALFLIWERTRRCAPPCDHTLMPDRSLSRELDEFSAPLVEVLTALTIQAKRPVTNVADDVTVEAFNLVCAITDCDGRHTDDELWALLTTFGPRFPTQLALATPDDLRRAGLLTGKREWLARPSTMFELLIAADQRNRTSHAWTYYRGAMELAQIIVALDSRPTETELRALDAFRTMLVHSLERSGVPRPGAERPVGLAPAPVQESGASFATTPAPPIAEPLPPPELLDDLLAELDDLVGLAGVKAEVRLVTNLLQVQRLRKARNLPVVEGSRHLVFTGNPGTGKTTVARLLARIYRTLGVVESGHLVESDRAGLVAGFVGQTALKVTEVFDRAMGGVLLVDEAYALARGGERDFGREAIDTLVKLIEDRRDALAVIVAGYPDEMHEFIDANPGLQSRFPKTIAFADYNDDELVRIFLSQCKKNKYEPTPDAIAAVKSFFEAQPRTKGFGNGRVARNLFEHSVANQASRLMSKPTLSAEPPSAPVSAPPTPGTDHEPTDQQLLTLEAADIPQAE